MGQRDGFTNSDLTKLQRMYCSGKQQTNNKNQNQPYYGNNNNRRPNNQRQGYQRPGGFGFLGGSSGAGPNYPQEQYGYYNPFFPRGYGGPADPNGFNLGWLGQLANFFG